MNLDDALSIPLEPPQLSTQLSTGVYLLFLEKALVYVGRSRDCHTRIASHRSNGRPFDFSLVIPCDLEDADWVEQSIVRAMEPVQNRVLYVGRPIKQRQILQAVKPSSDDHPAMVLNKTAARKRARACGLSAEFEDAVRDGGITFRKKNPDAPLSTQCVILLGDLMAWCEVAQRGKFGQLEAA